MGYMKSYTERFFRGNKKNVRYSMKSNEAMEAMHEILRLKDANGAFEVICTLFNYGYAKGYRARQAEERR